MATVSQATDAGSSKRPPRTLRLRAWGVAAAAGLLTAGAVWTWQRDALLNEARRAYQVGRWQVAYRLANESLRRNPRDRAAHLVTARSALHLGDWQIAEAHFGAAPPADLEDLRLRVEGLIRLRAWELAGKVCEQILALDPNDGLAAQRLAFTLYERDKVDEAIALCKQWSSHPKYGTITRSMLGWIYFDRADYRQAIDHFEAVVAADPAPNEVPFPMQQILLDLGKSLLYSGYPDRAETYLAEAYQLSNNPEVAWRLGLALQQQRKDAEAAQCWRQALDWNPDFTPALVALGERALQHQQPQEALEWLMKAATLEPNTNRIQYALSRAFTLLGDTERAREHRELADRLRKEEETNTAREQALRMSPRSPVARVQRAIDAAERGGWNEAERIAQELVAENPQDSRFVSLLERIRARTLPVGTPQ